MLLFISSTAHACINNNTAGVACLGVVDSCVGDSRRISSINNVVLVMIPTRPA